MTRRIPLRKWWLSQKLKNKQEVTTSGDGEWMDKKQQCAKFLYCKAGRIQGMKEGSVAKHQRGRDRPCWALQATKGFRSLYYKRWEVIKRLSVGMFKSICMTHSQICFKKITLAVLWSLTCRESALEQRRLFSRLLSRGGVMVTQIREMAAMMQRLDSRDRFRR